MINYSNMLPFKILEQVINYDNKVIGIYVKYKNKRVFIPLKPSSLNKDIDIH